MVDFRITFDPQLAFNSHIQSIASKGLQLLGLTRIGREFYEIVTLKTLYVGLSLTIAL